MTSLSAYDKLTLAAFLESATVSVAEAQAALALVQDDGLKKILETSVNAGEAQIKGVQEFCRSHGLA